MSASYFRPRIILFAFLFFYIVTIIIDFMFIMQIKLSNQKTTAHFIGRLLSSYLNVFFSTSPVRLIINRFNYERDSHNLTYRISCL